MNDEFFIGWEAKVSAKTRRWLKGLIGGLLFVAVSVAALLVSGQQTVAPEGRFDFGTVREFRGVLVGEPVPALIDDEGSHSLLVAPFKHGLDPERAKALHLESVRLKGTRIWRGEEEMIEVIPESIEVVNGRALGSHPLGAEIDLGEVSLQGEIVDSKCFLGVMNPGNLKPHRACAMNCIQGGIPPILLVRNRNGEASHFLLLGPGGQAINQEILELVAEPVSVRGLLKRRGSQFVLYADPAHFSRIAKP